MPKMVGNDIREATQIHDNAAERYPNRIKLSYSQAVRLDPADVQKSLDTSDRGSRGSYAKRWYRWFASASSIISNENSTPKMRAKAAMAVEQSRC